MNIHELKTDPEVFASSFDGKKNFEIRFNDRNFRPGDLLLLRETRFTGEEMKPIPQAEYFTEKRAAPLIYTDRTLLLQVAYILTGPIYGLDEGWVIMSTQRVKLVPTEFMEARGIE